MAGPATSSKNSTAMPRVCLSAVDEALLLLLAKRLARALLLEAEADMAIEPAQPQLDSAQPDSHS
jgi:hypothetical protein